MTISEEEFEKDGGNTPSETNSTNKLLQMGIDTSKAVATTVASQAVSTAVTNSTVQRAVITGVTCGLAKAGALVGGGVIAGAAVVTVPAVILGTIGYAIANKVKKEENNHDNDR